MGKRRIIFVRVANEGNFPVYICPTTYLANNCGQNDSVLSWNEAFSNATQSKSG